MKRKYRIHNINGQFYPQVGVRKWFRTEWFYIVKLYKQPYRLDKEIQPYHDDKLTREGCIDIIKGYEASIRELTSNTYEYINPYQWRVDL